MAIWKDLRQGARALRRTPGTTAIVAVTLALCIGANTAIFSVVDAALFRPLSYPEPERLAQVVRHYEGPRGTNDQVGASGRMWEIVRDHATFLDAAPYGGTSGVNFVAGGTAQYVRQQRVGAGFFHVLGIVPVLGREFTAAEDRPGGPAIVVLSYGMWQRAFGGDRSAIGRTLMLRGEPHTIVGVMPESFHSDTPVDLWTPLRPSRRGEGSGTNYAIVARLKPGVTWAQANTQLAAAGAPLYDHWKPEAGEREHLAVIPLQAGRTQNIASALLILWAAVGLVLLIGCANIASLLLARAASRRREIATRIALGAGGKAILRQLLVEALLLAGTGGTAGLLLGYAGLRGLQALGGKSFPAVNGAHLDLRVLGATALLALLSSLLAGVFPAFEATGVDVRAMLSEAGTRGVAGWRKRWPRRVLVAGEVALAMLLLIGAGLMVRTLAGLYDLSPGFDSSHVLTATFSLEDARYASNERISRLYAEGLPRLLALPGVESAGAGLTLPYQRALNAAFWMLDGPHAGSDTPITNVVYVTPGYLETLRIPLHQGRSIRDGDTANAALIGVANEAFRAMYLRDQEPLGSHVRLGGLSEAPVEIVGICGDVQQQAGWGDYGPSGAVPTIYVPMSQMGTGSLMMLHAWFSPSWVVRVAGDPANAARSIRAVMASIDPLLPIAEFRSMSELRSQTFAEERFQTTLLGALAGLSLLLAVVGIYGMMSQSVVERTRELGIRLALGASAGQAIRQATGPGVALATVGVAIGCLLALASNRLLRHLVWKVSTTDALTYSAVSAGLLLVAAIASLAPALRITRLNPADTLREE